MIKKEKKNMIIDFIVLGLIFIIPILYMITLARYEASLTVMLGTNGEEITKETFNKMFDNGMWLIWKFVIRWLIILMPYIFYKWKKIRLLIVTLILTILIIIINFYPDFSSFKDFIVFNLDVNMISLLFSIFVILFEIILIKKRKDY